MLKQSRSTGCYGKIKIVAERNADRGENKGM